MASRLTWYEINVPANTPQATPLSTPTAFNPANVSRLHIFVPPGPAGNVGIQIWNGGGPIWPETPGSWLVLDNAQPYWDIDSWPDNGAFSVVTYNTDIYPHLIQVGYAIENLSTVRASIPTQSPIGV